MAPRRDLLSTRVRDLARELVREVRPDLGPETLRDVTVTFGPDLIEVRYRNEVHLLRAGDVEVDDTPFDEPARSRVFG